MHLRASALSAALAAHLLPLLLAPAARATPGPSWIELSAAPHPPPRMAHTAVVDVERDRMIVFGGIDVTGLRDDVWILSFDPAPTWTQAAPIGTGPTGRWDHAAAYDPIGDRMLVFGGNDGTLRNDVWALSLADPIAWTELETAGAPPAERSSHTVVFDPPGSRLLVHGGFDGTLALRSDTWELSLSGAPTWQEITPSGPLPTARRDAIAAYDPLRRRFLLHGGNPNEAPFLNDAWALDLVGASVWTLLAPANAAPDGGITHAGTYDAGRDRLVIFAGNYHNETWALSLGGTIAWEQIEPDGQLPAGRIDHTLVYREEADRFVAFGGHTGLATLDDTWSLTYAEATAIPAPAPALLFHVSPTPASHEVLFRFDPGLLGSDGRIAIYDVAGREVMQFPLENLAPPASVRWDLRDAAGARAPAGVYVGELLGSRARATQRLVLLY